MSQGFYELLGVRDDATHDDLQAAYQRRLAELVRRLRDARAQGADVTILESRERALREAVDVLTDPVRRRRYDAFRALSQDGLPEDGDQLWARARGALVDPATVAALQVVRSLTELPLGDPLPDGPTRTNAGHAAQADSPAAPRAPMPPAAAVRAPAPVAAPPPPVVSAPPPRRAAASPAAATTAAASTQPASPAQLIARFGPDGRVLQALRSQAGVDLETLARRTRISRKHLEAIEGNQYDDLPATVFVRGYLREIVRVLEVPTDALVDGYLARMAQRRG